ncbi:MAG TPA: M20/M25/M40 family metallo-hydrolase, partial [Pirellulales bacterium]|nr:M20/M25/M40 family metallo-hydrolase [Pirellulales bacterium]
MNHQSASSELVATLSDLIALPSVNPMGRPADGPEFFEYRVTDYLERFFQRLGVPYARKTVEPKRDNIVARLDGDAASRAAERLLVFEAHQDTVPVVGMTIEPFTPTVRDGRIYGRGACDIKGGLAAMLTAFARLARERPAGRPTVVMASTVNEENGFSGAKALCRMWEEPGSIIPRRPDAVVVAEPTELSVVVAHKGVVR